MESLQSSKPKKQFFWLDFIGIERNWKGIEKKTFFFMSL